MLRRLLVVIVVVLCCAAPALNEEILLDEAILKITVQSSGAVLLGGRPTTLAALEKRLKAFKAANGSIWYYRENPAGRAPPEATTVMGLIIKYRLPVRFSTKPDFSDYVDDKGVPLPGKSRGETYWAPPGR
jgi:hypothetical protein